jgi:ADP-ribose pyrophosphatase YjhB (NUDIX family)
MSIPNWLDWAQRLQAVAQSGLSYDPPPFDRERYEQVMRIAAEIVAACTNGGSPDALTAIENLYAAQIGHTTPKIDVRGIVFRDGKMLLVQEKMDESRWTLPGGWADIGESAGESVAREVYEETGYQVQVIKLLALLDRNKHPHPPHVFHSYKAFFQCALISDERQLDPRNIETGEIGWFTLEEIERLDLSVARVTLGQCASFFEHLRDPSRRTDFD